MDLRMGSRDATGAARWVSETDLVRRDMVGWEKLEELPAGFEGV